MLSLSGGRKKTELFDRASQTSLLYPSAMWIRNFGQQKVGLMKRDQQGDRSCSMQQLLAHQFAMGRITQSGSVEKCLSGLCCWDVLLQTVSVAKVGIVARQFWILTILTSGNCWSRCPFAERQLESWSCRRCRRDLGRAKNNALSFMPYCRQLDWALTILPPPPKKTNNNNKQTNKKNLPLSIFMPLFPQPTAARRDAPNILVWMPLCKVGLQYS